MSLMVGRAKVGLLLLVLAIPAALIPVVWFSLARYLVGLF